MKRQLPVEFIYQLFSLFVAVILVHAIYVSIIRPNASAKLLADQQINAIKKINETKKDQVKVEIKTLKEYDVKQVKMLEEIMDQ
jgi:hypothetical protein